LTISNVCKKSLQVFDHSSFEFFVSFVGEKGFLYHEDHEVHEEREEAYLNRICGTMYLGRGRAGNHPVDRDWVQ
jgi:hypothetical protein